MNINDNYDFDIVIDGNKFYFKEIGKNEKKNDYNSTLSALEKIKIILENKLSYAQNDDEYSKLDKSELFNVLKQKTSKIKEGYVNELSKLSWINKKIFGHESKINRLCTRINDYITPSRTLPLPKPLIQYNIFEHLKISEIINFSKLNRSGRSQASLALIQRAQKFGYEGDDKKEATEYLKSLFEEVKMLHKLEGIPKKYFVFKENKEKFENSVTGDYFLTSSEQLNVEETLQHWQNLTGEDILDICMRKKVQEPTFDKLRKMITLIWPKMSNLNDFMKSRGNTGLFDAVKRCDKNMVQFLLSIGIDPNTTVEFKNVKVGILHYATLLGHIDIVKALIQNGANVNQPGVGGDTPLACACGFNHSHKTNPELVRLLLLNGANPNIATAENKLPLDYAKKLHDFYLDKKDESKALQYSQIIGLLSPEKL